MEAHISKSNSPGGGHDGSPTLPTLAWGEGYGHFVSALLRDTPLYVDRNESGQVRFRIDQDVLAQLEHPRQMQQPVSEYTVSGILWAMAKRYVGSQRIFQGMYEGLRIQETNRGVPGVDLVDFLDALYCLDFEIQTGVRDLVRGGYQFPYLTFEGECGEQSPNNTQEQ